MTDMRNWQMAFLKQARSDWDVYRRAHKAEWPKCYQLLFLQMTTEKLSKAFLIAGETKLERITGSHAAFVKFIRVISNHHNLHVKLGVTKSHLKARFRQFLPIAHAIETLAPALAQDGPNSEYPWRDKTGQIYAPIDYLFPLTNLLQSPHGLRLIKYTRIFLFEFEKLFLN